MVTADEARAELLRRLKTLGYRFIAVTPTTHATVLARRPPATLSLRDIFGWNRPFAGSDLSPPLLALLDAGDALDSRDGMFRSKLRVASLGGDLLLHGGFPTDDVDAVFFGPDTYRFARFIEQQLPRIGAADWLVDMGAGCGAGAIAAARLRPFGKITMVDINDGALRLAAINASVADVRAETMQADALPGGADLIIANPPYMIDASGRSYRDGGDLLGGAVALAWTRQFLGQPAPGATMLLYTGAAVVGGQAPLLDRLARECANVGASLEWDEIDPDVFGNELERPQYGAVDRIAVIGAIITSAR